MHSLNSRKRNTEFTFILAIFELVSMMGLLYYVLALLGKQGPPVPSWQMLIYAAWFGVSVICLYGMLIWKKWGVYGLGIATLCVIGVDVVAGSTTLGDTSLRALFSLLLLIYVPTHWLNFD
jgi:hypothetical protein